MVPPLVGVGVNVTPVPLHIVVDGDAAMDTAGTTAGASDTLPKLVPVEPEDIPAIPAPNDEYT